MRLLNFIGRHLDPVHHRNKGIVAGLPRR